MRNIPARRPGAPFEECTSHGQDVGLLAWGIGKPIGNSRNTLVGDLGKQGRPQLGQQVPIEHLLVVTLRTLLLATDVLRRESLIGAFKRHFRGRGLPLALEPKRLSAGRLEPHGGVYADCPARAALFENKGLGARPDADAEAGAFSCPNNQRASRT